MDTSKIIQETCLDSEGSDCEHVSPSTLQATGGAVVQSEAGPDTTTVNNKDVTDRVLPPKAILEPDHSQVPPSFTPEASPVMLRRGQDKDDEVFDQPPTLNTEMDTTIMPKKSSLKPSTNNATTTQGSQSLRESRCCFLFCRYETFIYIVGIMSIGMAAAKIFIISYYMSYLSKHFPEKSTQYFCAIGIFLSAVSLAWECPLLFFVRKRKMAGLQQWMFAMMLHFFGACLCATITGAVYGEKGLFLTLSFILDIIRNPSQMYLVHKFVKSEKLDEDSHHIAAFYKKL